MLTVWFAVDCDGLCMVFIVSKLWQVKVFVITAWWLSVNNELYQIVTSSLCLRCLIFSYGYPSHALYYVVIIIVIITLFNLIVQVMLVVFAPVGFIKLWNVCTCCCVALYANSWVNWTGFWNSGYPQQVLDYILMFFDCSSVHLHHAVSVVNLMHLGPMCITLNSTRLSCHLLHLTVTVAYLISELLNHLLY